jgi:16S rRNA (guanine527-N7)-methyltransferase
VIEPNTRALDRLAELIAEAPLNLVAQGERAGLRERHVAECLELARALRGIVRPGERWVDLGTGGGLPGLVLALAFPQTRWVLIDSVQKKARAVRGFTAELELANVEVQAARAEELAHVPEHRGRSTGVVARAVAPLRTLVELARGFVGDGGWLVAVKGSQAPAELEAAAAAMVRCRWQSAAIRTTGTTALGTRLVTMRAVGSPPEGIPRRSGVPQRRPL